MFENFNLDHEAKKRLAALLAWKFSVSLENLDLARKFRSRTEILKAFNRCALWDALRTQHAFFLFPHFWVHRASTFLWQYALCTENIKKVRFSYMQVWAFLIYTDTIQNKAENTKLGSERTPFASACLLQSLENCQVSGVKLLRIYCFYSGYAAKTSPVMSQVGPRRPSFSALHQAFPKRVFALQHKLPLFRKL